MDDTDPRATLRATRLRRSLTQAQVARWSGMQQGELSRLESGRHDPRLSTLKRLAAALDLVLMPVPKELEVQVRRLVAASRGEPTAPSAAPSLLEQYGVSDDDDDASGDSDA